MKKILLLLIFSGSLDCFSQVRIDKVDTGLSIKQGHASLILDIGTTSEYWARYNSPDTAKSIFHVKWLNRKATIDHVPDMFQNTDTIVIADRVFIYKKQ